MDTATPLRVLLVAEGSGGHLIPALQVARTLANTGARIKLWYAQRRAAEQLNAALILETDLLASDSGGHGANGGRCLRDAVDIDAIPLEASRGLLDRAWRCGQLWRRAQRCFDTFAPDVVVGFGGWVSAPIVLAAKRRHIRCVLHEQNVVMGRANQWLAPWVDRVAVSFPATHTRVNGAPSVMTGLPIRQGIGDGSRALGAQRFGFDPARPTLLILGGSQGAGALNHLMMRVVARLTEEESATWQLVHVTGPADAPMVRDVYDVHRLTAWVSSFMTNMGAVYAQADVVISRAGASTIAELAESGRPSILIPYPHAGGHQRANASLVEAIGGGVVIEEAEAGPERLLGHIRRLLNDPDLRAAMGERVRRLSCARAAERLTDAIVDVAHGAPGMISDLFFGRSPKRRSEIIRNGS